MTNSHDKENIVLWWKKAYPFSGKRTSIYAQQFVNRGELVLGGTLANPTDGAVLLFQEASPEAAERFAAGDPYVQNGLVTSWKIR